MILLAGLGCTTGVFTPREWEALTALRFDAEPAEVDSALVELGRGLYFDEWISNPATAGSEVSCASCHQLDLSTDEVVGSGADPKGLALSKGANGTPGRNSPTVLDTDQRDRWGWIARFCTLEDQVEFALRTKAAMNLGETDEDLVPPWSRQPAGADHAPRRAFESWRGPVTTDLDDRAGIEDAIRDLSLVFAELLRSLRTAPTRLDLALDGGPSAFTPAEARGAVLFVGRGHCTDCHSGPLLSDGRLHHIGIGGDLGRAGAFDTDDATVCDAGEEVEPVGPAGEFLTPSLRHAAATAPYMHDGSLPTLWHVIEHYDEGGSPEGPGTQDPRVRPLGLSRSDRDDLEAFLQLLRVP